MTGKIIQLFPNKLPHAVKTGSIMIGSKKLICAVLDNKERVVNARSIAMAMVGMRGGRHKGEVSDRAQMPLFLMNTALKPFISEDLGAALKLPISYIYGAKQIIQGYPAVLIPRSCMVWMKALAAGALSPSEVLKAQQAQVLLEAFSEIGAIALVDEITGYQDIREANGLQKALAKYISDKCLEWAKRFPDEFYTQIYRLKGWDHNRIQGHKYPWPIGKITNDLIYSRLAPGALEELNRLNPPNNEHVRAARFHQWLTPQLGQVDLDRRMNETLATMRVFRDGDWDGFYTLINTLYPIQTSGALRDNPADIMAIEAVAEIKG
jgi:hypothetical protein